MREKSKVILTENRLLLLIVFGVLLLNIFIAGPSYVPTSSMATTILPGDYLLTTKYDYGYSKYSLPFNLPIIKSKIFVSPPARGDVVVFQPAHIPTPLKYVKRVIGMPGDKIQIINNQIFINDIPVKQTYIDTQIIDGVEYDRYIEVLPNQVSYVTSFLRNSNKGSNGVFYVPQDNYFMLGDNRNCSSDSRFELGYVPLVNIVAKVRFIFFSTQMEWYNSSHSVYEFITNIIPWVKSIRYNRIYKKV